MNQYNFSQAGICDVRECRRSEKLQKALYLISETANAARNLKELYRSIHKIIDGLISANNLFIALYDEDAEIVHFPYYIDEFCKNPGKRKNKKGLTEYVIRTGQPLLVSPPVYAEMLKQGEIENIEVSAIDWMGIPLKTADNKVIGVLAVQTYAKGIRYTKTDKEILTFVSTQVAMVIERKRAEEALRESEEQYRAIVEHSHDAICFFSENRIVYANDNLCILLGVSQTEINTVNVLHYIHPEDMVIIRECLCQQNCDEQLLSTFEARIINSMGQIKFVELNLTKSLYKGKDAFIWALRDISERKAAEKLQKALYLISETVNSSQNLDNLYHSVHKIIGDLILAENFFIALYDESTKNVHFPYCTNEGNEESSARKNCKGLTEYVLRTGKALFVSPQEHAKLIEQGEVEMFGTLCIDWLGVPLKTPQDRVFGVLAVQTHQEGVRYTEKDKEILSFVSTQVAMAIKRKQDETRLQYFSFRDSLSGLYNRRYFEEEMRRMDKRRKGSVGLIIIDVDGLKLVNDIFGHDCGDIQIINVAKLLIGCFRERDVIARIGGDEYAILLQDADRDAVTAICERVQKHILIGNLDNNPPLSLSIGFAVSDDPKIPMRELFKQADNNMYREKLNRGQSVRSALVETIMKPLHELDFITEGHAERVQNIVDDLGEKCGLSGEKVTQLRLLAQFHDVGKVGILNNILFKPGLLTAEEMKEMRCHSEIGHRIARSSPDLLPIADLILKHHEWWNGKGYPLGLVGEAIPLECRILAIADAYDAMTSDRPYRKAMNHELAVAELKRCAGIQFDPELVNKFVSKRR
ncbi:MAG: domain S-box/diguanylate cyclase protein [Firmicutes bacterium]|nr:domain S-box/diguanylate cyclase protein [Bacillota bacterium]